MGRETGLSNREARWLALAAQGLDRPRPSRPPGPAQLRRMVETLGVVQLDAVNVLARTQLLVPFSRLGPFDPAAFHRLTGPNAPLLEGWAHVASLTPMAAHRLLRWRMQTFWSGSSAREAARAAWAKKEAAYIEAVLAEVRERGPLTAGMLSDPRRRQGEWWDRRSIGRTVLEHLFIRGQLAAWRSPAFERYYDLPERSIPAEVLGAPTPSPEEAIRELLFLAAGALGVGTLRDLADYYRMVPTRVRPRLAELVEEGRLEPVAVEGWAEPAYMKPGLTARRPTRHHATLLSPFDSLIWDRARTLRVFGFDYRIEIYVPEPKRRYGYFVLPLLLSDELVARFDLKADRRAGLLRVNGAYLEQGAEPGRVAEAAAAELASMAGWLGLGGVEVGTRGDLASALRRAGAEPGRIGSGSGETRPGPAH